MEYMGIPVIYFLIIAVVTGLLPAYIARSRGYNFVKWWIYGSLAFPIALPHSFVLKRDYEVRCPFCGCNTYVGKGYCRRCGHEFLQK
ncbi:MAG: hypothetical protein HY954_00535 [Deltaproteobacteria bacterium]|nr:hypothetical protein [Deltaproteobacteria bacterium]